MKTEMAPSKGATDKPLLRCPKCNSKAIWRIERSLAERIIYLNSKGKYATKKFLCKSCGSAYLIHREGKPPEAIETMQLEQGAEPLISCSTCGKESITIDKVTTTETQQHEKENNKTAFRKLVCNSCEAETIIYQQDYDEAFKTEI